MVKFFKRIVFTGYVLSLMAFTLWYGYFMYPLIFGFEGKEEAARSLLEIGGDTTPDHQEFDRLMAIQAKVHKTDLGFKVIEEPYVEGRFHHIGFNIQEDPVSICVRCHGSVPHDKSKEIRSFLNMHTFYLACETCHMPPPEGEPPWEFRWYDKKTGKAMDNPRALSQFEDFYRDENPKRIYPVYGNYGAKIAPGTITGGSFAFLHDDEDMTFVENYRAKQALLGHEQKSQMERVIHRGINKEPVACKDCHNQTKSYLAFHELGYPLARSAELTDTSVVGMIQKYKEFYFPSLLAPGVSKD